jgi:hypothetical protein
MDFSHVRVQIWVPENAAVRIRPGCKASFTAVGLPDRHFTASVTRVSYALERNVRTMLAEIDMENPGEVLQPGMYLTVTLSPELSGLGPKPQTKAERGASSSRPVVRR